MKTAASIIAGVVAVFTFTFLMLLAAVEVVVRGKNALSDIE
jgi:hypothetical protein